MSFVLILPLIIIILLFHKIETLKKDSYVNRWGTLYEGIKMQNKYEISFYLWFMLRRLTFICAVFFMSENKMI